MNSKKILKIFMMPQDFPCGEQSSCCGPIGQSEKEIQDLKSSIENELGYQVEVLNVKNDDDMRNHPRIVQLLHSFGPAALPIIALEDEVVSMGNPTPEKAVAAIREKTETQIAKENEMIENDNVDETRQENLGSPQACCPSASAGGDCCSPGSSSSKSWKMVVLLIIVVAAGVVLARSLIRKTNSTTDQGQQSFATIQPEAKLATPSTANATAKPETTAETEGAVDTPSVVNVKIEAEVSNQPASSLWGKPLDSLASLSKVAAETDAVFILLAAEDQQGIQTITNEIEAVAKKIQAGGMRISAFRLTKDAPDYAQLTKQISVPCVLAMVKGGGASAVSGEITETKLVQAFVMASRPSSGCCPSGAGASGCGPTGPKK